MRTIQVQDRTYVVEIADKAVDEVRVMTPGSNDNEIFYYDTTNGFLFPEPDGIICDAERHNAILVAVQEMRTAKQVKCGGLGVGE